MSRALGPCGTSIMGFRPWLCGSLAVGLWISRFVSLGNSFLICNFKIVWVWSPAPKQCPLSMGSIPTTILLPLPLPVLAQVGEYKECKPSDNPWGPCSATLASQAAEAQLGLRLLGKRQA